jgi:hypothetical protein
VAFRGIETGQSEEEKWINRDEIFTTQIVNKIATDGAPQGIHRDCETDGHQKSDAEKPKFGFYTNCNKKQD